ncbi:MAG: DUF1570 domain-containing protein, partial [Pirellula sp.]
ISDLLFDGAKDGTQQVEAYGQAWALTHFLMERHFQKTVKYYQKISQIESESGSIPRRDLVKYFEEIFGDLKALQIEWHEYMRSLKTDLERARDAMN